jgi:hypothetical protein
MLIAIGTGVRMRVTTTIFMLEFPRQVHEARGMAFLQENAPGAEIEDEIELRSFVSLYSGQNRIEHGDSSANEGA